MSAQVVFARPTTGIVRCPCCGAPVRHLAADVIAAILGDVDPRPPQWDCLWCGPAGVRRAHPPAGPVPVCVFGFWPAEPL